MNKKTSSSFRKILFILLTILLIWSVGAKYITQHEFIHNQIYKRHYIESETHINYLKLTGFTNVSNEQFRKCNEFCKRDHALNDIIGYNLALFIYFICIFHVLKFAYKKWWINVSSVEN